MPLPWVAGIEGFGFTDGVPWLPQPEGFDGYARNRQEEEPDSTLRLYVGALAFRRQLSLATAELGWVSEPDSPVLDFVSAGIRVTVNLGSSAVPLPAGAEVLLASEPLGAWTIEPDVAVWWRTARPSGVARRDRLRLGCRSSAPCVTACTSSGWSWCSPISSAQPAGRAAASAYASVIVPSSGAPNRCSMARSVSP